MDTKQRSAGMLASGDDRNWNIESSGVARCQPDRLE
jgi:hypothetical protein